MGFCMGGIWMGGVNPPPPLFLNHNKMCYETTLAHGNKEITNTFENTYFVMSIMIKSSFCQQYISSLLGQTCKSYNFWIKRDWGLADPSVCVKENILY